MPECLEVLWKGTYFGERLLLPQVKVTGHVKREGKCLENIIHLLSGGGLIKSETL